MPATRNVFVVLVDWEIGHRLDDFDWTQHETYTNCWGLVLTEKQISKILLDGVAMVERASLSDCNTNAGSYFFDTATDTLWVNTPTVLSPEQYITMRYFFDRFSTHAVSVDGVKYKDLLKIGSMKKMSLSTSGFHEGQTKIGFGSLVFINAEGYFDARLAEYVHEGKYLRVLAASFEPPLDYENLELTDFIVRWEGWSGDIVWTEDEIEVSTEDYRMAAPL